jgi:flagellar basal body-associated protein FliL
MEWLGRKIYPKARPYERRSRMQMLYLMVVVVLFVGAAVAAGLWMINTPMPR